MCGRTTNNMTWQEIHDLLEATTTSSVPLAPRFNVAPTQMAPVVRASSDGGREVVMLRWGLVHGHDEILSLPLLRLYPPEGEPEWCHLPQRNRDVHEGSAVHADLQHAAVPVEFRDVAMAEGEL